MFDMEVKNFNDSGFIILKNVIPKKTIKEIFKDFSNVFETSLKSLNINSHLTNCDEKYELLKENNLNT